jgi:hypothetical protein
VKFICPKPYDGKEKGKEARKWLNKMMVYIGGNVDGFINEVQAMLWFLTNMEVSHPILLHTDLFLFS